MPYSNFPVGLRVKLRRPVEQEGRRFERGAKGTVIDNYDGEAFTVLMDRPDPGHIHVCPDWADPKACDLATAFAFDWFAPMRACANIFVIAIALASAGVAVAIDDLLDAHAIGREVQRTIKIGTNTYVATFTRPGTKWSPTTAVWTLRTIVEADTGNPTTFALLPQ